MTLSEAREPSYSGTTSGEWSAPSLNEYLNAFATEADQDVSQVSDLSQESKRNIANRTLIGDPEADTEDDLIAFPVVATSNSLHEGAVDAALSRAPQANLSESTINSIQNRARSLLEEEFDRDLDDSDESRNHDHLISIPGMTARFDEGQSLDAPGPWTISGVALAEDEITRDPERGMLLWPAATLREAAASLEGQPVTANHPETGDGGIEYPPNIENSIGRITDAGYVDGVGVVYEATLSDEDVARKIRDGILDVSPDIGYTADGTDPETGAWVAEDAMFVQLGVVSKGAGPNNSVQLGPSRALASLSATDIQSMLTEQNQQEQDSGQEREQVNETRLQSLDEYDDPADAPRPNVGDGVVWESEAGGSREPSDRRYGVVVDGLQDSDDDAVLVAVYQPGEDYESWEPRNEQNAMNVDSLVPIGSDGVGSLPPISQVRNADADPRGGGAGGAEADEPADAANQNGAENTPEGDDARPNDAATEQSTPAGAERESTDAAATANANADNPTTTDTMTDEESQNAEADAEQAQAQEQNDAGGATEAAGEDEQAQAQEQNQNADHTADANEENRQADSSQSDKLKTRLADLHEQNNDLQQENEQLRQEVSRLESLAEGAGRAYAEALFDDSGPVTPEEALDLMSVEQLRQKYEETDDVSLVDEDDTPDVQGGDEAPAAAPSEHSASATASLSDGDQEEIRRLEESIEEAKRMDLGGAVRHYESRLADLRGAEGGD